MPHEPTGTSSWTVWAVTGKERNAAIDITARRTENDARNLCERNLRHLPQATRPHPLHAIALPRLLDELWRIKQAGSKGHPLRYDLAGTREQESQKSA